MPVLTFNIDRLVSAVGVELHELADALFRLKCETEVEGGSISVEVNPDRPDMFIGEGIARALKGLLELESGWTAPRTELSGLTLRASNVASRPHIAAALVGNVNIDSEDFLQELIQFQEKLHETIGRRRRKVAIGIHDADKLPSKEIYYRPVSVDAEFTPLGYAREVSIREFIGRDPKGREYGSLSIMGDKHPALFSGSEIIALPPVINSDITRVEVGTKSLFIDVTGTDRALVESVLDLIISNLAERSGAFVGAVRLETGTSYPLMRRRTYTLSSSYVSKMLGTRLGSKEIAEMLGYMRHNARDLGEHVRVEVPPFRLDIIGEVDFVEDIAIFIGYENLGPLNRWTVRKGSLTRASIVSRRVREVMIGLGFTETMQLILTSPKIVSILGYSDKSVEVSNPVQLEYSVLRPNMASTLLPLLRENQHQPKPVRVFEVGDVAYLEGESVVEEKRLGLAFMSDEASFEDVQAPLYSLLRVLGIDFVVEPGALPFLLNGRTGIVLSGGSPIGYIGEVKPQVLELLGIEYPVVVSELSLTAIAGS